MNVKFRALSRVVPEVQDLWLGFTWLLLEPRGYSSLYPLVDEYSGLDSYEVPTTMIKSLLFLDYPHLMRFTLEKAPTTLAHLRGFIRRHEQTLRHLSIKSLRLDGWTDSDDKIINSMLKLVLFLRNEAHLDSMSFEDRFFDHTASTVLHCVSNNPISSFTESKNTSAVEVNSHSSRLSHIYRD